MAVHGKFTSITLDATDISQFCNDFSIDDAADEVEVTGFGDLSKVYISGYRDISASLGGNWGADDGTGLHALLSGLRDSGATAVLVYGPAGDDTGNVKLTYDAVVLSFSTSAAIGSAVGFTSNLRLSNPTVGAFA